MMLSAADGKTTTEGLVGAAGLLPSAAADDAIAGSSFGDNDNNDYSLPQSTTTLPYVPSSSNRASSTSSSCMTLLCHVIRFCNAVAIIALSVVVFFLAMQVQHLSATVQHEQEQLNQVNARIANQTSAQGQTIQDLTNAVHREHALTLYQMAGTFCLLTCLLSAFHIYAHIRHLHYAPLVQRKIIAILWLSPIYATTSFLSLVWPVAAGYLSVIKDFYEAYAIFTFLSFLIAVLGRVLGRGDGDSGSHGDDRNDHDENDNHHQNDRATAIRVLSRHADHLHSPTRCLSGCYHPHPSVSDVAKAGAVVTECQILAMQFVFVRPLTSIVAFVYSTLQYSSRSVISSSTSMTTTTTTTTSSILRYMTSVPFMLAMINNVSVFLAFTGLLKFYHAVQQDLAWMQPFRKFMTIKGIVFLTFWQGLLVAMIVHSSLDDDNNSNYMNNNSTTTLTHGTTTMTGSTEAATTPTVQSPSASPWMMTTASAPTAPLNNNYYYNDNNNGTRYLLQQANHSVYSFDEAAHIQNFLICLEMLFFSIAHYCVFPVEEWEPSYRPQAMAHYPGIGLKDFVSDMSYIIASSRQQQRQRRRCRRRRQDQQTVPSSEDELDDANQYDIKGAYEGSRNNDFARMYNNEEEEEEEEEEDLGTKGVDATTIIKPTAGCQSNHHHCTGTGWDTSKLTIATELRRGDNNNNGHSGRQVNSRNEENSSSTSDESPGFPDVMLQLNRDENRKNDDEFLSLHDCPSEKKVDGISSKLDRREIV